MSVSSSLGLSCPRGGDFYVCEGNTTEFLGCCASNPCADGSGKCPTKDLRISSFNPDKYANIPPQGCDDPRPANLFFYTCTNNVPFIGCCAKNPCQEADGLCPTDHLIGTTLSPDAVNRTIFTSTSHISYATTAAGNSYPSTSPPHSPYFPVKHPGSPMSVDERHLSTYTDSNVSSLSGHNPRHLSQYSAVGAADLHPVSELDGVEQPAARAELGDGTPANLYGKGGDR
ncbi:hypothetical protein ColKHC_14190 [Colletotrichum higginsianum]|nr:hypothetical protein ColKHC_14190 [Colletotrichum higginsianum]